MTTSSTTRPAKKPLKPDTKHMPFFMTKATAPNVCFTRGPSLDAAAFQVGRKARSPLHSDLFALDFPSHPPPPASVDYEHENKLLHEEVLRLESQLVTLRCDVAVKDFELLGLTSENQYLRRHLATTQAKADETIARLEAQVAYAQKVATQQELALRRQARDVEESKAWILHQYFNGEVDASVPKPSSWQAAPVLAVDVGEASPPSSAHRAAWASSTFESIATPLLRSPTVKQLKLVSQLEDVENLLARCVEQQKASVSEVATIELAMEEACEQYYHVLDEPVSEDDVSRDDPAAFEFDTLISELNGLVCRYDSVTSCVSV